MRRDNLEGESVASFISEQVLEAVRKKVSELRPEGEEMVKLELGFGDENPLYASKNGETLATIIHEFAGDDGERWFIGYKDE